MPAVPQQLVRAMRSRRYEVRRKLAHTLHARDDQVQQTESELRILEIKLLEAVVVDLRCADVGLAAYGHGSLAVGGEQADLPDQSPFAPGRIDLDHLDLARNDIE